MSCDSMELPFLREAQPDLRSWQSSRRPLPRRGSTRSVAVSPLPLPLACEERRVASDHCGRRSRAQLHHLRRQGRIFRWGAISCGGPPGLGGDVYQFPLSTHLDLDNDIATESTPWYTQYDPVDHHMSGRSRACQWWNPCEDDCPKSCGCTCAGAPPMDHEIHTEYNPRHTTRL